MSIKPGNKSRLNHLVAAVQVLHGSDDEIRSVNRALPKGTPIFNTTDESLKISDGITFPRSLNDHKHTAYAPVAHGHLFGANIPWHLGNPKLWYADDLVNHPELVPLDGRTLSDADAVSLSKVYPGTKLVTPEITTASGTGGENSELSMTVDVFKGDYFGKNVFNDALTQASIVNTLDQWLTGNTNLDAEHSITVTFKGSLTYRITEYWMIPASSTGTLIAAHRPTPNTWVLEGSNNGSSWSTIHSVSDYTDWEIFTHRRFTTTVMEDFAQIRLRITKWNAGDNVTEDFESTTSLYTGLKRLWVFGRQPNSFNLPEVPSPHPDYVWVVPKDELNTGLKHEDVGDIGTTAVLPNLLPAYRIPTDGRRLQQENYPDLYAAIGHNCATQTAATLTTNNGSIDDTGEWTKGDSDPAVAAYVGVEFAITNPVISAYQIVLGETQATPMTWTLEAANGDSWTTVQSFTDVTPEEFKEANGTFHIDTDFESTTDIATFTTYRLNIVSWNTDGTTLGAQSITFYTHTKGTFQVPNYASEDGVTTYIVAMNTANDVSADIISRLQKNVIDLSNAVASLQQQITDQDESINKPTE